MNRVVSMKTLQESFILYKLYTDQVAQFQSMGGRYVLITFQSVRIRNELTESQWMQFRFEYVKPWKGEPASMERFVWLSVKGMPLGAWNASSFKKIAEYWVLLY